MKRMKNILSVLLTLLLILLLVGLIGISSIKNGLNETESISFLMDVSAEEITKDNFLISSELAHKYLDEEFQKRNIPTQLIDYMIANEEFKALAEDYKDSYIDYMQGKSEKPNIPTEQVYQIIESETEKYNQDTGNTFDSTILKEQIETSISKIEDKMDSVSNNKVFTFGLKVLNNKYLTTYFVVAIAFVCIVLFILQKTRGFIFLSVANIGAGVLTILLSQIMNLSKLQNIKEMLGSIYSSAKSSLLTYGFITIIIGILISIIPICLHFSKKGIEKHD